MKYSEYVDVLVQNSECFSFDHYVQGLRKYTRDKALHGEIGKIKKTPIDQNFQNTSPVSLVLGETNRHFKRYSLIETLLNQFANSSVFNRKDTDYFKTLLRPYIKKNFISKYRVQREIDQKIFRILKIYEWMKKNNGDISGVTSFIAGEKKNTTMNLDFPISIKHSNGNNISSYIQLDGSHRRCVASFLDYKEISSIVVTMEELEENILIKKPPYFYENAKVFFDLIKKIKES